MGCRVKSGNDEKPIMTQPVFRFAPSPNGYLHLGHALSALLNSDLARAQRGRLLLRIEDIDAARCRPQYEQAIYEDLAWLGIEWEHPVRRQSEHLHVYREALAKLDAMGLVYATFESRSDIGRMTATQDGNWPCDPDGAPLYPGHRGMMTDAERNARMRAGEPFSLRLDMHEAIARAGPLRWREQGGGPGGERGIVDAMPQAWGDVVLARKDVPTSYHLSVVVDDALQGITHVVRGQDLFWSTSAHRLLQALLQLPEPVYRHHRLVLDADGRKLAKSTKATALRDLRGQGSTPADIRIQIGMPER